MAGFLNFVKSIAGIYDGPYENNNGDYQDNDNGAYDVDDDDGTDQQPYGAGAGLNRWFRNQASVRNGGNAGGGGYDSVGRGNGGYGYSGNGGSAGSFGNGGGGLNGGMNADGSRAGVPSKGNPSNVVNLPQRNQNYVLVSSAPDQLSDAQQVCEHLRDRHVVIVNVEGMEGREAQRIVDFIGGAVFALDGEIIDINKRIFAVAPSNVDLLAIQRDPKSRGFKSFGASGG